MADEGWLGLQNLENSIFDQSKRFFFRNLDRKITINRWEATKFLDTFIRGFLTKEGLKV